jgi:hypothetical protein
MLATCLQKNTSPELSEPLATILGPKTWNACGLNSRWWFMMVRRTGRPRVFPLLRIFTISARSSLNRKSASLKTSVPLNASRAWKIGEIVEAPLAKNGL